MSVSKFETLNFLKLDYFHDRAGTVIGDAGLEMKMLEVLTECLTLDTSVIIITVT